MHKDREITGQIHGDYDPAVLAFNNNDALYNLIIMVLCHTPVTRNHFHKIYCIYVKALL